MPDVAQLKSLAIARMKSAGMIHPHTGMEDIADKILNDFAEACFIVPEVTYASLGKEVKEKRKSDAS